MGRKYDDDGKELVNALGIHYRIERFVDDYDSSQSQELEKEDEDSDTEESDHDTMNGQ